MPKCPECGTETVEIKDADWEQNKLVHTFPVDSKMNERLNKYNVPFRCKSCGGLKFPLKLTLDRVAVFPDPVPEKIGSIYIPLPVQHAYQNEYGVVMAVGPGYVHKTRQCFIPTEVKVGDRVAYDKNIMGKLPAEGSDGKIYELKFMGEQDIQGIVEE